MADDELITQTWIRCITCGNIIQLKAPISFHKGATFYDKPECRPKPPDWEKMYAGVKAVVSDEDADEKLLANQFCDGDSCQIGSLHEKTEIAIVIANQPVESHRTIVNEVHNAEIGQTTE
jgi:hypothetical protein